MRTFIRKSGRIIEKFESKNIQTAISFVVENDKVPCFLITKFTKTFIDGSEVEDSASWFVNHLGKLLPVSKGY